MVENQKYEFLKSNRFRIIRLICQILFFIFLNIGIFQATIGVIKPSNGSFTLPIEQGLANPFSNISSGYNAIEFYISNSLVPFLVAGTFFLIGILVGRSTCSWVCPFGFIQELMSTVPQTKIKPVKQTEELLSNIPYVIILISLGLSVLVGLNRMSVPLSTPIGSFSNGAYTELDPYQILISVIPSRIINGTFPVLGQDVAAFFGQDPFLWVQIFWLLIILLMNIWVPQVFCRYICPTGLILGHLNEFCFFGLKRDPVRCLKDDCKICEDVCPMNIPILKLSYEKIKHRKCIYCLKCIEKCPEKALKLSFF